MKDLLAYTSGMEDKWLNWNLTCIQFVRLLVQTLFYAPHVNLVHMCCSSIQGTNFIFPCNKCLDQTTQREAQGNYFTAIPYGIVDTFATLTTHRAKKKMLTWYTMAE